MRPQFVLLFVLALLLNLAAALGHPRRLGAQGADPSGGAHWSASCAAVYPTRLWRGARARVDWTPPLPNIVRTSPGRHPTNAIGRIEVGGELTVLDGPRCVEGWRWWYVQGDNGVIGWTSEGEANEYWLEPLTSNPTPDRPCVAEYTTRLQAGMSAWLSDDEPNSVRTQPTVYAQRLGYIAPGATVTIGHGPRCADGWIWWYVFTGTSVQGWTSEGGFGDYWLTPLPDPGSADSCPPPSMIYRGPGPAVATPEGFGAPIMRQPALNSSPIGVLLPAQVVLIAAPPRCVAGAHWWPIRLQTLNGWVLDAQPRLLPLATDHR